MLIFKIHARILTYIATILTIDTFPRRDRAPLGNPQLLLKPHGWAPPAISAAPRRLSLGGPAMRRRAVWALAPILIRAVRD